MSYVRKNLELFMSEEFFNFLRPEKSPTLYVHKNLQLFTSKKISYFLRPKKSATLYLEKFRGDRHDRSLHKIINDI